MFTGKAGLYKKLEFSRISSQTSYYYVTFNQCIQSILNIENSENENDKQKYLVQLFGTQG